MGRPASLWYWKGRGFATDVGGRRTVLVKGPKTKANRDLAQQKLAALLGAPPETARSSRDLTTVPLSDLFDSFLADVRLRVSAGEMKSNTLSLFYEPYVRLLSAALGSLRICDLNRERLIAYRTKLIARDLRPNTVKNHLDVLRTMFRWARREGYPLPESLDRLNAPSRQRRNRIPTDREVQQLLQASPSDVRDVLEMLISVAVRPGDLFALTWGAVDVDAGVLRLADSKTGPRLVCLNGRAATILKRRRRKRTSADEYVFTTVRGRRWNFRYFGEKVRAVREEVGLGPHVTAYCLRHFMTTTAFLKGLDVATVRALRGDKDVKTTLIYEHLASHLGHLQAAARRAIGEDDSAVA